MHALPADVRLGLIFRERLALLAACATRHTSRVPEIPLSAAHRIALSRCQPANQHAGGLHYPSDKPISMLEGFIALTTTCYMEADTLEHTSILLLNSFLPTLTR